MDILVFGLTVVLLVVLIVACLLPVGADSPDDQGDGMTEVVIPRHVRTPRWRPRTLVFFAVTGILSLVFLTVRQLPALYSTAVGNVADAITRDPATVNGYITRLRPALVFFGVAYVAGIALVLRANLGRRLAVLSHAALYIAMSILTQALMIAAGIASGWLVAPFGIEATLANLLVGGLVVMRLTFTTFVLPRATTLPMVRRPRLWDTVLTCCALVTVVTVLIAGYAYLSEQSNLNSVLQVFLPLYAVSVLFIFMFTPLWLLWWVNRRLPEPGPYRPPLDIIIPAYNETDNIARLLRSVDVAAARYGGPVQVVVSDDGSTDDTAQVAEEEIADFRHARGRVLTGPNGRQSAALNRAIAATDAEIIVRVDADCVLGEDTLVYTVPWFSRPPGLVLDPAPRLLLVLHPGRPGRPHLPARTRAHQPQLPGKHPDVPAALRGRRRGGAGHQPAVRRPVQALAEHPVVTHLVRVRIPAPDRHPGGGHLAAGPAVPGALSRRPAGGTRPHRARQRPVRGRPAGRRLGRRGLGARGPGRRGLGGRGLGRTGGRPRANPGQP